MVTPAEKAVIAAAEAHRDVMHKGARAYDPTYAPFYSPQTRTLIYAVDSLRAERARPPAQKVVCTILSVGPYEASQADMTPATALRCEVTGCPPGSRAHIEVLGDRWATCKCRACWQWART